jgi:serine phosphatase RsbU (regulator of sigma subunit)
MFAIRDQAAPYALVDVLAQSLSKSGLQRLVLHLASHDGESLVSLVPGEEQPAGTMPVEGTMPGRVFVEQRPTEVEAGDGLRMLVPVSERSYRLGVLELIFPELDDALRETAIEHALLAAHLLITDGRYTDYYLCTRRMQPMALPAELQWQLLPPRAMGFGGVSVAGMLVPAYDVGGDLFDYGAEPGIMHMAIFDVMGHGVVSAVISGLVAGAFRNARRSGADLQAQGVAVDAALRKFEQGVFTTGVMAEVDPARGELRYLNYGHPDPILLRGGATSRLAPSERAVPLGLTEPDWPVHHAAVQTVALRYGDVIVLHTDGAVEIRDPHDKPLDEEGFEALVQKHAQVGTEPWELTRRIAGDLMSYRRSDLVDDATVTVLRYAPEDQAEQ